MAQAWRRCPGRNTAISGYWATYVRTTILAFCRATLCSCLTRTLLRRSTCASDGYGYVIRRHSNKKGLGGYRGLFVYRDESLLIFVTLVLEEHTAVTEGRRDKGRGQFHLADLHRTVAPLCGVVAADGWNDRTFDLHRGGIHVVDLGAGIQGQQVRTEVMGRAGKAVTQFSARHKVDLCWRLGFSHGGACLGDF